MIGQRFSHYRIVERVGAGGMGEVYRARDENLNRDVAVKILPPGTLTDEQARKRFRKEAQALSRFNHPHIATVHDFASQDGVDFLVMEYVEGTTLAARLRDGALPVSEVCRMGMEIGEALEEAHAHGIVHRDLKPANVALNAKGQVKVLDFGLAKALRHDSEGVTTESLVQGPQIVGTLPYMSPEQLRGAELDHRSDLYSLGVVLYEMSTGRRPFESKSSPELMAAILTGEVESPRSRQPNLPRALEHLVLRCLERDPGQRFQTAREVVHALRRVSGGRLQLWAPRRLSRKWVLLPAGLVTMIALAVGFDVARVQEKLFGAPAMGATLLIMPLEVRGQVEGADYVGRAFAEAMAVSLVQRKGLSVLPVPGAGELEGASVMEIVGSARTLGAGYVLQGSLTRESVSARATLSLVDTRKKRIVWGTEAGVMDGELSAMVTLLAGTIAERLGAAPETRYDHFLYSAKNSEMARSVEMAEVRQAIRAHDFEPALAASARLIERFPAEPDARALRAAAFVEAKYASLTATQRPDKSDFDANLNALRQLDPHSPWLDVFQLLMLNWELLSREVGDGMAKVLARDDLTPAARAFVLAWRAEFGPMDESAKTTFAYLEEAVRLDPTSDIGYLNYVWALNWRGRFEAALVRARQALSLNPTWSAHQVLGKTLIFLGRYDEAADALVQACGNQEHWVPCQQYGWALGLAGRTDEALSLLSSLCEKSGEYCPRYAIELVRAGRKAEAEKVLLAADLSPRDDVGLTADWLSAYHAVSGNRSEALRALQLNVDRRQERGLEILGDPDYVSLRGSPEFEAIVIELRKRWEM